jgi:energy-coupling factor transporter ATP-binding protein EcfA2
MSVLAFERFTYTYPGGRAPALDGITLSLEPGELVIVAGVSGSGKSTLLRAASGLVPHFHGGVVSGRVTVVGMDTREHGPGELAQSVGTLFQDPETQIVMGTVRAELAFGLENRGEPPAAVARAVEEAALALGIAELLDRPTAELSGGELQRVALGAALAGRPALVVLDEPTSQLDPVAGDELIGLLRRLNEDFDTTIVLAEHRLERCLGFADRVLALAGGRVVCDGTPEEFLAWAPTPLQTPGARLLAGLGVPPVPGVKRARAALRDRGLLPSDDVDDVDDFKPPTGHQRRPGPALTLARVWFEVSGGPAILRGTSLTIGSRERVALMGRNGAGKSTLLRLAAGLAKPTRGKVTAAGRVALLLQNPNDYLIHDTVGEEASEQALATVGLTALSDRNPRDLSGGERQRLALAIVLGGEPPAVVCLDEPTRGMDRARKADLALLLVELDAAVLVATHDPEFVAAWADRVVLLADGAPIADGTTAEVLTGGTYFATETSRILSGRALTPDEGVALLTQQVRV